MGNKALCQVVIMLDKIIQLIYLSSKNLLRVLKVPLRGRTGKPVKFRYGPAAVTPPLSVWMKEELI